MPPLGRVNCCSLPLILPLLLLLLPSAHPPLRLALCSSAAPLPLVLLPSVLHWDSTNRIFVTPSSTDAGDMDIVVQVEGENTRGQKIGLFHESVRTGGDTRQFKVSIPRLDPSHHLPLRTFFVKVDVTGHQRHLSVLGGASDLRQLHLQTDKVFYRPEERVNIRALPLTGAGQLYTGPVQFQLLVGLGSLRAMQLLSSQDPNGFRIFNKTNRAHELALDPSVSVDDGDDEGRSRMGFVSEHFELPKFLRFGEWRVLAFAVDEAGGSADTGLVSSPKFQSTIRIREYVVPRFLVFMDLEESRESPLHVQITVLARFAHGMLVNGDLSVYCSPQRNSSSDDEKTSSLTTPEPKKLHSAELVSGVWRGPVDLSICLGGGRAGVQLEARVFERGTFQSSSAFRDYDPFAAGFELVPLRPALTQSTPKLLIYLRPLSSLVSEGRAQLTVQCISEEKSRNGLNQSLIQRLGTISELDADQRCVVRVIRAQRELSNGNLSEMETLVVPSLDGVPSLDFSLLSVNPQRADYVEGEVLEARLPSDGFNYAMICNYGREVVAVDRSGPDGRVLIPITARMRTGPCVLYAFGPRQGKMVVDMRLFFVRTGLCPQELYGMRVSTTNATVGTPVEVDLRARADSLALLHAYDSRLEGLLKANSELSRSAQFWSFAEFLNPDQDERSVESFAWFSNLVDLQELFAQRKSICRMAGKLSPQCSFGQGGSSFPKRQSSSSPSRLSDDCQREMREECESQKNNKESADQFLKENDARQSTVRVSSIWLLRGRPEAPQTPTKSAGNAEMGDVLRATKELSAAGQDEGLFTLRDFFPEVWLFNDYHIGANGSVALPLKTPHSVTEWHFSAKFWSSGRTDVCEVPRASVNVHRHVFMEVDLPLHVYENETVQVQVTISADNLASGESKHMAVCFRGLSPQVCGDVGRDGSFGETDFTRVVLSAESPVQLKRFFVRFLRSGSHNLSFELRAEDVLKGHDWHCRDNGIPVFDRISKRVRVSKRVDVEEHFRQIVVYRRRKLVQEREEGEGADLTLGQVLGEDSRQQSIMWSSSRPPAHRLASSPDVISYSVEQPTQTAEAEGGEAIVQTQVSINADKRRVYSLGVEFSKFIPSFPPALSTELLSAPSPMGMGAGNSLQRIRNRPVADQKDEFGVRNTRATRKKKKQRNGAQGRRKIAQPTMERPMQGYSLPGLIKELGFVTYELKSLKAMLAGQQQGTTNSGHWVQQREQTLGNMLSELLTFSDCVDSRSKCAFGEYARPTKPRERNLLLTTLATSLLCEQRAADEYVCGPIQFLAQMVGSVLNETGDQMADLGLDAYAQFDTALDRRLFLESLLVQTALDCSAYACAAESWKHLHASFYSAIDLNAQYDVRVVAALAYTSTPATRTIMRGRLASRTRDDNEVPFWTADDSRRHANLLERSFQKSSTVLANALALLAYTRDQEVYGYWKREFNFEALSDWLVEQQDSRRQYENALDTFFASRALYQFASVDAQRQVRDALLGSLQANFSIPSQPTLSRHFNDYDLPFALAVSPTADKIQLDTRGSSKLLLGVRVLMEKRKRSRREPSDAEPVSISMSQRRAQPGFINQTVTITAHSQLIRSLQIEHGLFTGFTSQPHFVHVMNSTVHCQTVPRVSATAVHFVLTNLTKESAVVYSVTVMEPKGTYSPSNLAPIAISAIYHHLSLGQLIVLPESIDFGAPGEFFATRQRRAMSPGPRDGGQPGNEEQEAVPLAVVDDGESTSIAPPAHYQSAAARSFLTQLSSSPSARSHMQAMVLERSFQQFPSENGVCTCAETACIVRCSSCDRLTFAELCQSLYAADGLSMRRFALFFRISPRSTQIRRVQVGSAEYTVLENVHVVEWKGEVERPAHVTIWLRNCNVNCLNLLNRHDRGKSSPRFLLIGDPLGLFDEGASQQQQQEVESAGPKDTLLQTHYLMHDNDRLMRSTDCHELFGRVEDESCEEAMTTQVKAPDDE